MPVTPLTTLGLSIKRDLNINNENVHDLKRSGKQPLSDLKISQSVKLIAKDDALMTERKVNAKESHISCRILEIAFSSL